MNPVQPPSVMRAGGAALALALTACSGGNSPPTDPGEDLTPVPTIASVEPAVAAPTQRLTVRVRGTGFDQTAVASWERNGTNEAEVVVHSTTFVSATEVLVDISVGPKAPITLYDVGVRIKRKRGTGVEKGIRRESFMVGKLLAFSGALTSVPQPVREVCGDAFSCLHSDFDYVSRIDFAATLAAGMDRCTFYGAAENNKDAYFQRLRRDGPISGTGYAHWDTRALDGSAADNLLLQSDADATTVDWGWQVKPGLGALELNAARVDSARIRFTGGVVELSQGPWQRFVGCAGSACLRMSCPNLDTIVVAYPVALTELTP